jgi:hypothetical protein
MHHSPLPLAYYVTAFVYALHMAGHLYLHWVTASTAQWQLPAALLLVLLAIHVVYSQALVHSPCSCVLTLHTLHMLAINACAVICGLPCHVLACAVVDGGLPDALQTVLSGVHSHAACSAVYCSTTALIAAHGPSKPLQHAVGCCAVHAALAASNSLLYVFPSWGQRLLPAACARMCAGPSVCMIMISPGCTGLGLSISMRTYSQAGSHRHAPMTPMVLAWILTLCPQCMCSHLWPPLPCGKCSSCPRGPAWSHHRLSYQG